MRILFTTMDALTGTLMSFKAKHMNEESNSKGKKLFAFKVDHDDKCEQTSSEDKDDEDMTLLTRRFKNIMRE